MNITELQDLSPEELKEVIRSTNGLIYEVLAKHIDAIVAEEENRGKGCMGALALTGSPDGRRQYEATVCTSPRNPNGETMEKVVVKRDRI